MTGPFGLIAAMPQESRALLHLVKGVKRARLGQLPPYSFAISDLPCVLVTSGMGIRRAGQAAQALVENYHPSLLISFGIAGAVEPELEIGDVVLAGAFCLLEQATPGELSNLSSWPAPAQEATQRLLSSYGKKLFIGTTITTTGSQVEASRLTGMAHPVLEMETAGIARVAAQNGTPILSLRSISDGPCAPIPLDLAAVMDEDANLKLGALLKALVRNPMIIFQSRQMMRNSAIAADSAALALFTALNHWDK